MSPLYAIALILNPSYYIRYIETYQPKKQLKPILAKVKKLQERYKEEVIVPLTTLAFTYSNPSYKLLELDTFNRIVLSLCLVARLASKDKYEDYNLLDLYNPSKKGAFAQWCQDTQQQCQLRLLLIAIDILSILLISNELERVFSRACYIVSQDKGQMTPKTMEMRECLKHQKRSGILDVFLDIS